MKFQKLILLFIASLFTNSVHAYRESFIAFEVKTGHVFESQKVNRKVYPASLTKLMTAFIILKNHNNLNQIVEISKNAWGHKFSNSSRMFLEPEMLVTVDNLLKGLLVQSGNDAAIALAEFHSGTTSNFVKEMNETAFELGMKGTRFANPNGRHNRNHYTTANDFMILVSEILRQTPQIKSYTMLRDYTFNDIIQWNRNRTLKLDDSIGLKTGFTPQSGFNLAACYTLNHGIFCTIEFGARSIEARKKRSIDSYTEIFKSKQVYTLEIQNELLSDGGFTFKLQLDPTYVLTEKGKEIEAYLIKDKHTNGANSAVDIEFKVGDTLYIRKAKLIRYSQTD
ncbi:D-alanyl-D-alanine carboxypeptidase family protein [Alteromonas macleodii]|uniref:D-alanyl-D-alanine carboxypeptidase family protein n=1 Tax=Alteromonas macleodii TaxID=28108 RepID=UPI00313FFB96